MFTQTCILNLNILVNQLIKDFSKLALFVDTQLYSLSSNYPYSCLPFVLRASSLKQWDIFYNYKSYLFLDAENTFERSFGAVMQMQMFIVDFLHFVFVVIIY